VVPVSYLAAYKIAKDGLAVRIGFDFENVCTGEENPPLVRRDELKIDELNEGELTVSEEVGELVFAVLELFAIFHCDGGLFAFQMRETEFWLGGTLVKLLRMEPFFQNSPESEKYFDDDNRGSDGTDDQQELKGEVHRDLLSLGYALNLALIDWRSVMQTHAPSLQRPCVPGIVFISACARPFLPDAVAH
ncbi:MAG TPA: hypothetical protein PKY10_12680, partial [Lentisphaeria bacterium]|nr:hypothetical protein [Lentisphaeria bacterium]